MSAEEHKPWLKAQDEATEAGPVEPRDKRQSIESESALSGAAASGPVKPNDGGMPSPPTLTSAVSGGPVKPNDGGMPSPPTLADAASSGPMKPNDGGMPSEPAKPSDEFVSGEGA